MPIELGIDSLRPTHNFQLCQEGISALNKYSAGLNMSCARSQRSDAREARSRNPSVSSQALYH